MRYAYFTGRFIILDTGIFSVCDVSLYWTLRAIWHVGRFVILDTEVCLLYRTLHYIGHRDIQCM